MTDPVDLTNLRELTGGDVETEKELFEVFITSSEECLIGLKENITMDRADVWHKHAHAWKGISFSLGAEKLGKLCYDAQEKGHILSESEKLDLIVALEDEYEQVRDFLNKKTF